MVWTYEKEYNNAKSKANDVYNELSSDLATAKAKSYYTGEVSQSTARWWSINQNLNNLPTHPTLPGDSLLTWTGWKSIHGSKGNMKYGENANTPRTEDAWKYLKAGDFIYDNQNHVFFVSYLDLSGIGEIGINELQNPANNGVAYAKDGTSL